MSKLPTPSLADMRQHPVHILAFGFGSGLAPVAPGTFGTLVGIPFFIALAHLGAWGFIAATLLLFLVGIPICGRSSELLGVHDHGGIVWDEIVGYLITMAPLLIWVSLPGWEALPMWAWLLVGFGWFRLFDIAKPWPVKAADQHVHGGLGIMLDDVLAAVYAALAMIGSAWLAGKYLVAG